MIFNTLVDCLYKALIFSRLLSFIFIFSNAFSQNYDLLSPNGEIKLKFYLADKDTCKQKMFYEVSYQDKPTILQSGLGLVMADRNGWDIPDWDKNIQVLGVARQSKDTTWQYLFGEKSLIRDNYNELRLKLSLLGKDWAKMDLWIRAYNEGIAFRYFFPEDPLNQTVEIEKEFSEFALPDSTQAWYTNYAQGTYQKLPLEKWKSAAERPLTLELPKNIFLSLGEAALVNYCRTRFFLNSTKKNTIITEMAGSVLETPPLASPWRVIMIADSPTKLIEHNFLYLNLNEATTIQNLSWIRPGKVYRDLTLSTSGAKKSIDFAQKHKIEYILFDAGWYGDDRKIATDATRPQVDPKRNPSQDFDFQEVMKYAQTKNVDIFVYLDHRILEKQLDSVLVLYKRWGIKGLKFGFVHTGSHRWTAWLHEQIQKASQYEMMINIHDEYRPTGYSRTYPNVLTQEGIYGNENMPSATQNCILPFTRGLSGASDYTNCYYQRVGLKNTKHVLKTTPAHQLALSVILFSPLQHLFWYDKPEDYQNEPEIEFFEELPTVWDETRLFNGKIGEHILMARRKGQNWFVAGICNEISHKMVISFDFLDPQQTFVAHIYQDGTENIKTRTKVLISKGLINQKQTLNFSLKSSGGLAIRLYPASKEDLKKYKWLR